MPELQYGASRNLKFEKGTKLNLQDILSWFSLHRETRFNIVDEDNNIVSLENPLTKNKYRMILVSDLICVAWATDSSSSYHAVLTLTNTILSGALILSVKLVLTWTNAVDGLVKKKCRLGLHLEQQDPPVSNLKILSWAPLTENRAVTVTKAEGIVGSVQLSGTVPIPDVSFSSSRTYSEVTDFWHTNAKLLNGSVEWEIEHEHHKYSESLKTSKLELKDHFDPLSTGSISKQFDIQFALKNNSNYTLFVKPETEYMCKHRKYFQHKVMHYEDQFKGWNIQFFIDNDYRLTHKGENIVELGHSSIQYLNLNE